MTPARGSQPSKTPPSSHGFRARRDTRVHRVNDDRSTGGRTRDSRQDRTPRIGNRNEARGSDAEKGGRAREEGERGGNRGGQKKLFKRPRAGDAEARAMEDLRATGIIDVVDFAVARAHELRALRAALREKRGTRRVYQALAWHARRRTMSHSARRMPRRLRAIHLAQLAKVAEGNGNNPNNFVATNAAVGKSSVNPGHAKDKPGPKGARIRRKYRGRSRFLSALRALRLGKPGLLETHVWHAKRFHMTCVAGMRIAGYCNDRGERSALRCAKRACLAHDESYLRVVSVRADTSDELLQKLRSATLTPDDMRRLSTPRAISGARLVRTVVLARNDVPIGPVDVLRATNRPTAWLWTHPQLVENVIDALNAVGLVAELASDQPGRFRLTGPSADKVLTSAVHIALESPCARTAEADLVLTGAFNASSKDSDSIPPPVHDCLWEANDRAALVRSGGRNVSAAIATGITVPVWIVQRGSDTGLYGWDVIVPKSWCLPLWLRLMHANRARAAGLKEIHALTVGRISGPVFPEEFVDADAPRALVHASRQELLNRVAKRPPAKRPNVGLGFLAVLAAVQSSIAVDNPASVSDETSPPPAKRLRSQLPCLPSVTSKRLSNSKVEATGNPLRILRGLCALRDALGRLAGAHTGTNTGTGCDDMFVVVAIRAIGRGVPRRDAIIRWSHSAPAIMDMDTMSGGDTKNGDTLPEGVIGAVVDGAFGLECGRGIGRALVSVTGLRTAADACASGMKGRKAVSKGRSRAAQPEIPVSFQNVRDNCVWRNAVVTVVLG